MATEALIAGDLSKIRGNQSIRDVGIFITPRDAVVVGTITAVPEKYPFVSLTVTWDGSASGVRIGQMTIVRDGDTIVSYGIVRKDVSGGTLYISETPLGAHGLATNVELAIEVGHTVTVYNHHPLWSLNSRIAGNTFYKRWDVVYASQNEATHPVCNTGTWQAAILASGETTHRFTLPRNGVNTSFGIGNDGSVDVTWTLPAGVTLVSGYALDDYVIEVDAVAGQHLISCIADTGIPEHEAWLWLFVADGTSGYNLLETNAVTIESDNQNRLGRTLQLTVVGSDLQDTLYKGAGLLLREWPSYNGDELSVGAGIDTFVGYIAELSFSHDGNIGSASVTVEAPLVYAQRVGQASQSLTEIANPTKWTECDDGFSNPRGFVYYLMKWTCPALLDMHDLDAPYETPRRKYLECTNKNVTANLQVVANYLAGSIGSASDGATVLRANPLYMSNANRNAVESIWTILEQDIKAPFDYFRRLYNSFGDVRGGGFFFLGTATKPKAAYAGRRWLQGAGATEMPNFTVTASEGISAIREKVGHFAAEQNAEIQEIALDLLRNQDVIDPAYLCWYALTVGATYDPFGIGFSGQRLLATEVSREWGVDNGGIKKRIRLIGQVETFGQAAEELPIGNVRGISAGGWSLGTPVIFLPDSSGGVFGGSDSPAVAFIHSAEGKLAICFNYYAIQPEWTDLSPYVDNETVNDFDFDYGSAYFADGRDAASALGLYVLTMDGTAAHVWYFGDVLNSPDATFISSSTLSDSTLTTEGRIACSETYPDLVLAVFKDNTGTRYSRSTDGGASFGALVRVGSAITDIESNENAPIGLVLDGQRQLLTAPNASAEYGTYLATTAAGAFSKLTASQDSPFPIPMISADIAANDYAYVSSFEAASYGNDFDGGDYFSYGGTTVGLGTPPTYYYTTSVVTPWTRTIDGSGNPGNCSKFTCNSPNTGASADYVFDWTNLGSLGVVDIEFDIYYNTPTISNRINWNGGSISLEARGAWYHVRARVDYNNYLTDFPDVGTGYTLSFTATNTPSGTCDIFLDNITFYLGDGNQLWRVEDVTGTPNWVNVTPASNRAPIYPYALAVDRANTSVIHSIANNGNWYRSTNSGSSWTTLYADTDYRCIFTRGDAILVAGTDIIALSLNGGDGFTTLNGDLDSVWNEIGTIKRIIAL